MIKVTWVDSEEEKKGYEFHIRQRHENHYIFFYHFYE